MQDQKVSAGVATWAGIAASVGQYAAAIAVFLNDPDKTIALGPLATATVTLLAVVAGRMQQANVKTKFPVYEPATAGQDWGEPEPDGDDEPGDPDGLPEYATDEDMPPDEGDTAANGTAGKSAS